MAQLLADSFEFEEKEIVPEKKPEPSTGKLSDHEILDSLSLKLAYNPDWAIRLIKYCEKGNSCEAFCGEYRISPSQLQKWARENTEFEEAMNMARATEIWYWERQLSKLLSFTGDDPIDSDLMKICKFKLENLGYGSKLSENSKVIFKDQGNKTQKQLNKFADTRKDAAQTSEDDLNRMVKALYGSQETIVEADWTDI